MKQSSVSPLHKSEHEVGYFGWRVLSGAVIGLALSPGPVGLVLIGALAPGLARAHGWSFGQIMFSLTILNMASILPAPFAGQLIDRLGARAVLLPSIVVMALCLLAFGYEATTLARLYAVSAIYGFATIGAQSLTYTKLLTSWFNSNRGVVLGIASSGLGLGYAVLPLVIAFGLETAGASGTTVLLAVMLVALPLSLNFFVAYPRETTEPVTGAGSTEVEGLSLREAVRTAPFWNMAAAIFLISVIATGIVPNFANIARDLNYEAGQAATVASIFGLATLIGRLLVGWLFDRYFAPRVACVVFMIAAAGFGLAACVTTFGLSWPVLAAAGVMMGLGFGAESDLIGYLASRYFGYRHFGAIYGSLLAIFIVGAASGPLIYGTVRDMAGGYRPILTVCAALGAVASFLMLLLPRFPQTPGWQSVTEHDSGDPGFPAVRSV